MSVWVRIPPWAQDMIKLRRFLPSDLEEVMKIEKLSFSNREAWSKDYFERFYREHPKEFIIAESKEKIIGYAMGEIKNTLGGKIVSLAVAPDWRRRKVGKKLTNFLISHLKEKGIKEISLHVRTKNKVAISFYKSFDFKILKTEKNYFQNGDDAYLMRKEI
jgi:ribosomal-protein-alanine N-acetyltransferase